MAMQKRYGLTLFEIIEFETDIIPFDWKSCRILFKTSIPFSTSGYFTEDIINDLGIIYVKNFIRYNCLPYVIDAANDNHVYKMNYSHILKNGYSLEFYTDKYISNEHIIANGDVISESDALFMIVNYRYNIGCTCINGESNFSDFAEVKYLGLDSDHYGEVSISTCKNCGRYFVEYFYEHEAFTASGRRFKGLIEKERITNFTPNDALTYLNSIGWHWASGSYYHGNVHKTTAEIKIW
jgi:hypothetical protein